MFHHDAQSKALEKIVKRYLRASGFQLPALLSDFRVHCLETAIGGVTRNGSKAGSTTGSGDDGANRRIVFGVHHLRLLDEHWQVNVKSRYNCSSKLSNGMSSSLRSGGPPIKDHTEFLRAVDQVRRSYLGTCIPSPEAVSLLENLDEMQQTESASFLKSIAATTPSTATSPHPKRSGSISHQTTSFGSGVTGNGDTNTSDVGGGSEMLTDTLNNKRTSIQALTRAGSKSSNKSGSGTSNTAEGSGSGAGNNNDAVVSKEGQASRKQTEQVPKELEQQIAEILQSKRRSRPNSQHGSGSTKGQVYGANSGTTSRRMSGASSKTLIGGPPDPYKGGDHKAVVLFGWTLHMLHANTLQYACIWTWLYAHEGSSRQNDLIRTRRDWKVSYGDRVWLVSYWFATRNAKMELPEYLPRARGAPCRHVVPYGETYVICKTCPADVLCMRCFRDQNEGAVLCDRCFRSHNHFKHDVEAQIAEEGMTCSCHDNKSWKPEMHCTYHNPGVLESEYLPKPLVILPPIGDHPASSSIEMANILELRQADSDGGSTTPVSTSSTVIQPSSPTTKAHAPHRCGHIFQPGEDIYHCRDCSFNDKVVLCSRCFHGSACINHRWRMGAFQTPEVKVESGSETGSKSVLSTVVESLSIGKGSSKDGSTKEMTKAKTPTVSCDCGDPAMFKTAFDCNYHLPQEFRPMPNLIHCDYLFKKGETMFRCRTCHYVGEEEENHRHGNLTTTEVKDDGYSEMGTDISSDIWVCRRCFDPTEHRGHDIEALVNERNEGYYCHCGDPTILRRLPPDATLDSCFSCEDDHNRQTVLCTTEIKEGMVYYSCKTCQTDPTRVFCEPCFAVEAHVGHSFQKLPASDGFMPLRCGCGENSAFRFATHCQQHERVGGTNIVHRCHYRASAGEWISFCSDCYPPQDGMAPPYLCQRCRQGSEHTDHNTKWVQIEKDMPYPCACGSHSLSSLRLSAPAPTTVMPISLESVEGTINPPALCQYHAMIYKTTPSTTLFLHSHNHRFTNHQEHNEVTGYRYHDSDNDWIICRPDNGADHRNNPGVLSPYFQWKDVFWLQHVNTGKHFNSMASLKISQGFQEVSALEGPHSNNDWIVEETTWLRQQILSDE
ncbi:E3 ubiquitin-protein ligase ubr1 [Modicella reniformis]|uniref:E3 ubiquitin-protein ligase n=1 Tax=Modicella reniformis TaxID=1440133 RepID=A0A9P6SUT2_9FUNG|nr:E3 ubiquitin-protein ligase ubr1 [Modicella reniformis]